MRTFVTALLGTPAGNSDHIHANLQFMMDFLLAHHLLRDIPNSRQMWLTSIHIYEALEKLKTDSAYLLPRKSDRFELPISSDTAPFYQKHASAKLLKAIFLSTISSQCERMRPGDQLVILFFGHGSEEVDGGKPGERIKCGEGANGSPVWIAKKDVERILKKHPHRRVSIISTSCFASAWTSDKWALFAAGESLALPPSTSDRPLGSSFVTSMAANSKKHTFHPAAYPVHKAAEDTDLLLSSDFETLQFTGDEYNPDDNIMEAFQILRAAIHGNQNTTKPDFTPSTPSDMRWSGWTAILGIETSVSIIMAMHRLQRRSPNPLQTGEAHNQAMKAKDKAEPSDSESDTESSGWDTDSSESDAGSSEPSISTALEEKPEDFPFDSLELEQLVEHWHSKTRPRELTTSARMYLGILVGRFQIGQSTADESQALYRYFKARSVADHLADQLAEEFGISDTVIGSCADFREVDGHLSYNGINFWDVRWGRLAPKADRVVDRLQHQYRKAGQWVFASLAQSKKPATVLVEILERVGGGIQL
jgi:hypothetical protein